MRSWLPRWLPRRRLLRLLGSMASEGFCRADGGQSITFPPTVPFLSPMAVLTSIQGFKEGEAATASRSQQRSPSAPPAAGGPGGRSMEDWARWGRHHERGGTLFSHEISSIAGDIVVDGNLNLSRALGDLFLKPYVSAEPDVTALPLDGTDEFVILASDGVWQARAIT